MSNRELPKLKSICIHCGNDVKELFKKYSSSVLKVTNCEHCNELADKYIEFEPIIIAIDLVLLSRPAYRHVLFNTHFSIHWKLNLVILLLDAYILWMKKSHLFISNDESFTYYFYFGLAIIDNCLLLLLMQISLLASCWNRTTELTNRCINVDFFVILIKAITLANIAKFFLLPIIIWNNHTGQFEKSVNFLLVMGYFLYGLVSVHSVVSNMRRKYSAVIIIVLMTIKALTLDKITNQLEHMFL